MFGGSGDSLNKVPEPRYIYNPGNVTLSNGLSTGQMIASVKAVQGATGYIYHIAYTLPQEDSMWQNISSSTSKFTFKELHPANNTGYG